MKKFLTLIAPLAFLQSSLAYGGITVSQAITNNDSAALADAVNSSCDYGAYVKKFNELSTASENALTSLKERANLTKKQIECFKFEQAKHTALAKSTGFEREVHDLYQARIDTLKNDNNVADAAVKFMDMNWGVGFGFSISNDDAIQDAEIVNGVVRVKKSLKEQPRVILEFHKYLWCQKANKTTITGCGPFFAVAATKEETLNGVAMGFMYGFKSAKATEKEGFSLGLGFILDADVKDLAKGFKPNQPVPAGETSIRYETKARWSTLLFATRTF